VVVALSEVIGRLFFKEGYSTTEASLAAGEE
jgi:hypothetical protein